MQWLAAQQHGGQLAADFNLARLVDLVQRLLQQLQHVRGPACGGRRLQRSRGCGGH